MEKSSFQIFRETFESALIKAHKSLIWLECFDYEFVMDIIEELCNNQNLSLKANNIRIWNNADMFERDLKGNIISGYTFIEKEYGSYVIEGKKFTRYDEKKHQDKKRYAKQNTQLTLDKSVTNFTKNNDSKLLIARVSASLFEKDNGCIVASLQDFVYHNNKELEDRKRTILLIASNHFETLGLEHICEHLTLPLPNKIDIQGELGWFIENGKIKNPNDKTKYVFAADFLMDKEKNYEDLVHALYGMYLYDIRELLHTLSSESLDHEIQYYFKKGKTLPTRIKEVKKQMVKNSGLLEVIDLKDDFDKSVADIDNLRRHLEMERDLMKNQDFLKSKLPKPKGILLVGAPGCGKSTSAKATASILNLDLYRLNIGDLLGHKYGQSENQFNEALRTAEASAPCVLWIDEIEKAFAGAGNTQNNDDTLTHIIGRFLTWMQEHETLVYLVATANDISDLKPELKRKGRWDEIFYLVYPGEKGRETIFNAYMKKYELSKSNFPMDMLPSNYITQMEKMSGAAIESIIINIAKDYIIYKDKVGGKETIENNIKYYLEHGVDSIAYENFNKKIEEEYKPQGYKPASNNS